MSCSVSKSLASEAVQCRSRAARISVASIRAASDVPGNGAVVRGHAVRQVEHRTIHIAPAPSLRRVIPFDDRMAGGMKMCRRVPMRGVVAATHMAAGAAEAQVDPLR